MTTSRTFGRNRMSMAARALCRDFRACCRLLAAFALAGGGLFRSPLGAPDDLFNPPEDPFVLATMDPYSESGLRRD